MMRPRRFSPPVSKGRMVRRIAVTLAVLLVALVLIINPWFQGVLKDLFLSPFQESYPEEVEYTLQRTIVVDANGGKIPNYTVDLPVPESMEGRQEVIEVETNVQSSTESRYDRPWMVFEGEDLQGEERSIIEVTYRVRTTAHVWDMDRDSVGDLQDIPESLRETYVGEEWKMQSEHPDIVSRAESIAGNETDVYGILHSIYRWVTENIDYPSTASSSLPKDSVETLSSGEGDCDEQAILFCALARSLGVPAWMQLGLLYDPVIGSWGGHGWVQVYLPLEGEGGVEATIDTVNEDFLVWGPNRLADYTDDGNGDHLKDYYYIFHYSYDEHTYPGESEPQFSQDFEVLEYEESGRVVI